MPEVVWKAKWIWKSLVGIPNEFVYFRKTFETGAAVKKARILITAESWYELYINGKFVHKGTSVSYPEQQIYDDLDVANYLRKGKNTLAVLVNYYGIPSGWSVPKQAALMAQLTINGTQVVVTDNSWKCEKAVEWKQDVSRRSFWLNLEYIEVRDFRKRIRGWNTPGFDDACWQASAELRKAPYGEWGDPEERSIAQLKHTPLLPVKLIRTGLVTDLIPEGLENYPVFYAYAKTAAKEFLLRAVIGSKRRQSSRLLVETSKKCCYALNGGGFIDCTSRNNFQSADFQLKAGKNILKLKFREDPASGKHNNFPQFTVFLLHFTVFPLKKPFALELSGIKLPAKDIAHFNAAKQMAAEEIEDCALNVEGLLKGKPVNLPKLSPGSSYALILDFGKEVTGYPVVRLKGAAGTVVDLGCAEHLTAGRIDPVKSEVHYTDRFTLADTEETVKTLEWKGFRYLQVTFRNVSRGLKIKSIHVDYIEYPFSRKGKFECSDPLLNRIYEVAAYSANLCMRDTPMDCPWREKRPWIEDSARILMTGYYADCDYKYARSVLRQQGFLQDTRGRVWVCMTLNEEFPFQTFEWACALWDYFVHSGDKTLLFEMLPKLKLCVQWLVSRINKDGVFWNHAPRTQQWVDNKFSSVYGMGLQYSFSAMNAKFCYFLDTMAKIYALTGDKKEAVKLRGLAKKTRVKTLKHFWNKEKGMLNDTLYGDGKNACSEISNGAGVAFEVLKGKAAKMVLGKIMEGKLPLEASPSHKYYIYNALLRYGQADFVLAQIKERYKYMLDKGATSFWEDFTRESASRCHGWSGYPAAIFSREILGVKPVEDGTSGFSKVTVRPKCFELDRAKGEVPTPRGNIKVSWQAKNGKIIKLKITAPKGVKVIK